MTQRRWLVPESWAWVNAIDVADIVGGGTPSTKDESNFAQPGTGVPWIGPADLTGYKHSRIARGRRDLTTKGLATSGATLLPAGAVLFSSRAPIGYCAIAENPLSTNQGFKSWVCKFGVIPEFVRYYLLASTDYINSLASGTTFREVSGKRVETVAFPLPSAAEQRRIVAKLDTLTACLARARAELEQASRLSARLRDLTLANAFACEIYQVRNLGQLLTDVRYGTAQKCEHGGGPTVVLRIPNIQTSSIDLSDLKSSRFTDKEIRKLALQPDDVLVIRSNGSIGLVGRSAVVSGSAVGMLYAGYLIRLRPDRTVLDSNYLQFFLSSPQTRSVIEATAKSTSGVNNINAEQLKALSIPIPDLQQQRKIVAKLRITLSHADHLEAEAKRTSMLLDRLESAIFARAFRGELVPQDPNDEPASVLLERVRAKQATAPKIEATRSHRYHRRVNREQPMPIPTYKDIMIYVLRFGADGETSIPVIAKKIADALDMTEAERTELLPSGTQTILHNRAHWARFYLGKAGLVASPVRGRFFTTDSGKQLLQSNPSSITMDILRQYPSFSEFYDARGAASPSSETLPVGCATENMSTPEEQIDSARALLHAALKAELLQRILEQSPAFFEQTICRLLVAMGYGGSQEDAARHLGRSGDGGVDGVINEDRLGLDRIYVQAKRYAAGNIIGRPDVQAFVGSLAGHHAGKGVFVTTSSFSTQAADYVRHLPQRVILIEGDRLADLMIEHGVGVRINRTVEVKRIDEDFFLEE